MLDDKSEKYIFISYNTVTKGYQLYNPIMEKVIVSRDVNFEEIGKWNWSVEEKKKFYFIPKEEFALDFLQPTGPSNEQPALVETSIHLQRK